MKILPAGVPAAFEVSYPGETGLDVAIRVFDVTTPAAPTVALAATAMEHIFFGTYVGRFTPDGGKRYLIQKGVYTDGTFAFPDTDYGTASEAIYGDTATLVDIESKLDQLLAQGSGQNIVGLIDDNDITGVVACE